jgi:hypothetical protein
MTRFPKPTLCTSFRDLARWTAGKIRSSTRHRLAFNEETITESLLLKLAERHHSPHFKIRSWSKQDEGTGTKATGGKPTGADWDFFFADHTGAGVTVRVQAKRQYRSGCYDGLDGTGQQIKDLVNNCGTALPIYVFYNDPTRKWPFAAWLCDPYCNPRFRGLSTWGCSFAAATSIPAKNKPKPGEIKGMQPWHCLVCPCPANGASSFSLPQRVTRAIQTAYGRIDASSDERFKDAPAIRFEVTDNVPLWAQLLMTEETRPDGKEALDGIGAELNAYLTENGLDGVALVQQLYSSEGE